MTLTLIITTNMTAKVYTTRNTFEVLPSIAISVVTSQAQRTDYWSVVLSWGTLNLDIGWKREWR